MHPLRITADGGAAGGCAARCWFVRERVGDATGGMKKPRSKAGTGAGLSGNGRPTRYKGPPEVQSSGSSPSVRYRRLEPAPAHRS